ncbi:glycosyltransferase family 4 protein [Ligilactobacillus salivarius]|uniref:glycosyltransferase family 4 protein n=2 Tax=Ligilactobacillus salivarius TaxID=1624 RepID=UPI001368F787|nr:glycosyltransferase family 4 protein [Ligilactobacillus salivarius]MYY30884.1 glycosyltransferase family 4 protein [Ligilactobacillus salivarius]
MNKQIKILFCLHHPNINNGAIRSIVDVIENLVKKYDITVYVVYPTRRSTAIDYLEKLGVKTIQLPFYRLNYNKSSKRKGYKYIIKKFLSPFLFLRLRQIVKKEKINIVYSNTIVIDYGFIVSEMTKLPHIWHIREFGKEDHGILLRGGEKALYQKLNRSKGIVYISKSIKKKYSPHIRKDVLQKVIYNDISKVFINKKNEFNINPNNTLKATIIGVIKEGKGQLVAVKAVEKANKLGAKIELHICGEKSGDYYKEITNYVKDHKLSDQVYFDGFKTKMNEYRSDMDIGIVASRSEAFGRVTVEGMLSNLAMIGADSAATSELITDNVTGLLYKNGDIDELAEKLVYLYKDRKKLKELAINGFDFAKKFTEGNAANEIYNMIAELN